jgi:hypothetical protein
MIFPRMTVRWLATVAVAALSLAACGGGTDKTKAQVRLVNATIDYGSLQMSVDGSLRQSGLGYGSTADYTEVDPGKAASIISQTGSATSLLSFTPSVSKGDYYTVLAYGALGTLKQVTLDDNGSAPDANQTYLRVINAAPDAGSLDVFITGSSDSLASSVAVQAGAAFGSLGSYLTINSGTWRLRVSGANAKTDLRLDLTGLVLDSKQVATLVLTPGTGGVLVNALLLTQQSGINRLDNTQARMRLTAGVTSGGSVTASVGGTTVGTGLTSPVASTYTLVPAGAQSLSVSVNGNAVTAPTGPLTAGADYTLLVYGSPTSPVATRLQDDNHLPTDTTQAKLRLVNGVSPLSTPLALTADFLPIASNVSPGAASDYGSVLATTTAKLSVTAAGQSTALFSAVDQVFSANANYTLFVVGSDSAAVGILRKDR